MRFSYQVSLSIRPHTALTPTALALPSHAHALPSHAHALPSHAHAPTATLTLEIPSPLRLLSLSTRPLSTRPRSPALPSTRPRSPALPSTRPRSTRSRCPNPRRSTQRRTQFANLCGTVYHQGNVVFTADGNTLVSPVGNRVTVFDLVRSVCGDGAGSLPVLSASSHVCSLPTPLPSPPSVLPSWLRAGTRPPRCPSRTARTLTALLCRQMTAC